MSRPNRETVARLLASEGRPVRVKFPELLEDVDGAPLGVAVTETEATWSNVSLAALGWTEAEYNNPSITE